MEEKNLDAQKSIELISRMIQTTRIRLERNSGRPFLIWGYTTVVISLFNYFAQVMGMNPTWSLTWFAILPVGCLLSRLMPSKKRTEPRTEIDRIVTAVWKTVSLALIPAFIFGSLKGNAYGVDLFAMIALLMAIGTAATGLIVRSKIYTAAGFTGMALSPLFALHIYLLRQLPHEKLSHMSMEYPDSLLFYFPILIFAGIFVIMMVIPGHIINYKATHTDNGK